MRDIGIDYISVFNLPPAAYVELAAELGCASVSFGLNAMDYNPHDYPRHSLREDAALRREVSAALAANAIEPALGENLPVVPDNASAQMMAQWRADLEVFRQLGVTRVNSVSFEPDFARNVDQYGLLADVCGEYGVKPLIEFVPIFAIADLATARRVVEQVGHPNLGLIVDTMHVGRTGTTAADLAALPPELVGYIQLCDAPWTSPLDYMDEAMHERRAPGEGDLPLADYLAALPSEPIVSLEIPQRSLADAGIGPRERLGRCIAAARVLLR